MKGMILAGGAGTRLYPVTQVVSKQLLPVFDKPMIYYPLSTLMLAGIREVLIITTPEDVSRFRSLLGDGRRWGMSFDYAVQSAPEGIAQAYLIGAEYLADACSALVLGDNLFYGHDFAAELRSAAAMSTGATIFAYPVNDPQRYGVIEFDAQRRVIGLEEKPRRPKSRYALTGLYFCDARAVEIARSLQPSARGELEIVDLLGRYLAWGELDVNVMGRGHAWFDTGTHESLLDAGSFVQALERRQGLKIACPEEVAFRMSYIDAAQLERLAQELAGSSYGEYLSALLSAQGF